VALLSISVMISVAIVAGSAYATYVYLHAEGILPHATGPTTGPVAPGQPTPSPIVVPECGQHVCNYVVFGNDSRKGLSRGEQSAFGTDEQIGGGKRSDTVMLVHIDPAQEHATVVSFPRDLWVDIPEQGMGKLTSSYGGGPYRLTQTVRDLAGLEINGFLGVNLAGFEGVVRALGGVDLCVDRAMFDEKAGLDIPAGCQRLSPEQALAFVRARSVCGDAIPDFARIARQQQFLRAVLADALSPGSAVLHATSIIDQVLPNLIASDNIQPADVIYLVNQLRGLSTGAVDFRTVTGTPGFEGPQSVVHIDEDGTELLRRLRAGKPLGTLGLEQLLTPPSTAVIDVRVFDAASGGAADGVHDLLDDAGFLVRETAVPPPGLAELGPGIYGAEDSVPKAEVVHKYLPGLEIRPAPAGTVGEVDVAVIVDGSFTPPPSPSPQPSPPGEPSGC
jgi:LCP family protein required for cell wall assembly